jgi:PRTRC genetic system protein E
LAPPEEDLQQEEAAAEPEAEDTLEEGELPGEDDPDEVTDTEATLAPAALLPVATIEWPEGTLGEGLFSQLAATLGAGESLSLVLARAKGKAQLLVTVQPVPIAGELNATAVPLQINGTPASLDDQLIPQMTAFRAARAVARETTDYLGQVKAAAEQAKKAAEDARKKASKPASSATAAAKKPASDGSLKLEVAPAEAMIVLTDSAGKTHPVKHSKDVPLPVGEYTVIVEADGYTRHEEKITIRSNCQTKKGVVLLKASAERLL